MTHIYRVLCVVIYFSMFSQQNRLSKAEMAHLRLAAGAAMLKICEQKGVGDQFTAEQFYNLSHLMVVSIRLRAPANGPLATATR